MNQDSEITLSEVMRMIENYDSETAEHCRRVAILVADVCARLDYAKSEELYRAALVHDIGKILIPKEILHKRSKLDRLEALIIKSHAHWGYEILSTSELTNIERLFVLYHHGFYMYNPDITEALDNVSVTNCIDNDILEGSMILQACDIFDAVTSKRSYHRPLSQEDAYEALAEKHIPDRIIQCLKIITFGANNDIDAIHDEMHALISLSLTGHRTAI